LYTHFQDFRFFDSGVSIRSGFVTASGFGFIYYSSKVLGFSIQRVSGFEFSVLEFSRFEFWASDFEYAQLAPPRRRSRPRHHVHFAPDRVWRLGFRVQGSGSRVHGLGV